MRFYGHSDINVFPCPNRTSNKTFHFLSPGPVAGQQQDLQSPPESLRTPPTLKKALFFEKPPDSGTQEPAPISGRAAHSWEPY